MGLGGERAREVIGERDTDAASAAFVQSRGHSPPPRAPVLPSDDPRRLPESTLGSRVSQYHSRRRRLSSSVFLSFGFDLFSARVIVGQPLTRIFLPYLTRSWMRVA